MFARFVRLLLALVPLAAGLYLLRLMPLAALGVRDTSGLPMPATLRIDPLVLSAFVLLPLAGAVPQPSIVRALRLAAAVILSGLALAATDRLVQLLLFYAMTLVLAGGLGSGWFVALGALTVAALLPQASSLGWLDLQRSRSLALPLLLLASLAGLGCLPWAKSRDGAPEWEMMLRPLWLFPLLKTFAVAPWSSPWPLVVPLVGTAVSVWAAVAALRLRQRPPIIERVSAALLGMALICAGLSSSIGIAAALWVLLAYALLILWTGAGRRGESPPATFLLLFLATWWTAAAAAGGAAFLVASAVWLAGISGSVAVLAAAQPAAARRRPSRRAALAGMALLIALLMPLATQFVAVPVADLLDPGLTPYGMLGFWPWIGVAALDPAHRRVALMPSIVLASLFSVTFAIAWLWLRAIARAPIGPQQDREAVEEPPKLMILDRVWWIGHGRG